MPSLGNAVLAVVAFFALCALAAIPLARWERAKKKAKIEKAFAGRAPLNEQTFYETYFRGRGVPEWIVFGVRRVLEDELETDLSRLSAADDFDKNLSFFWEFDSMASVEIVMRLDKEFGIKVSDAEAGKASTVEEIVTLVWTKVVAPAK